jgi:hypothetical protein
MLLLDNPTGKIGRIPGDVLADENDAEFGTESCQYGSGVCKVNENELMLLRPTSGLVSPEVVYTAICLDVPSGR